MRHPAIVENPGATLTWQREADTQAFAKQLAQSSALGHALVLLHGELGTGKTTLVRYLLQSLGVAGHIKSPTYTVVESYELPGLAIWHFDFYRFNDPLEWEDAGFRDIFASPGLKLVEWPERAASYLPTADLELQLSLQARDVRQVQVRAHTPLGQSLLHTLHPQVVA